MNPVAEAVAVVLRKVEEQRLQKQVKGEPRQHQECEPICFPNADSGNHEDSQNAFNPNQQTAEYPCKIVSEKMMFEKIKVKGIY
jgi:hypothetical protein